MRATRSAVRAISAARVLDILSTSDVLSCVFEHLTHYPEAIVQLLSTCTSLRVLATEPFWCHLLESHFPVARANDYVRAGETYKTLYAKHGAAGDVSKWLFNLEFVDPASSGPIQSFSMRGVDAKSCDEFPGMWAPHCVFTKPEGLAWTITPTVQDLRALGVRSRTLTAMGKEQGLRGMERKGIRVNLTANSFDDDGNPIVHSLFPASGAGIEQDGVLAVHWTHKRELHDPPWQYNLQLALAPDIKESTEHAIVWRVGLDFALPWGTAISSGDIIELLQTSSMSEDTDKESEPYHSESESESESEEEDDDEAEPEDEGA